MHTPGPWTSRPNPEGGPARIWIDGRYGGPVADAKQCGETEANALLICAAPDLLAALRDMVEAYRDSCADDEQPSMVKAALAAIARATQP